MGDPLLPDGINFGPEAIQRKRYFQPCVTHHKEIREIVKPK